MAARKTPATKKTIDPKPSPSSPGEFYFQFDNDSLYEAVNEGSYSSLDDVHRVARELHLDSGDTESSLYIYKVERLPVKTIKTTVEIV